MKSEQKVKAERIRIAKLLDENRAEFDMNQDDGYLHSLMEIDQYYVGYRNALVWLLEGDKDEGVEDLNPSSVKRGKGRPRKEK